MTTYGDTLELLAWLGPAADQITPRQLSTLIDTARDLDTRYPDPDEADEREAALSAIVQLMLDETTPEDANRRLITARAEERRAYVAALEIAVFRARHDGVPKAVAARESGIDRMRLLNALGER